MVMRVASMGVTIMSVTSMRVASMGVTGMAMRPQDAKVDEVDQQATNGQNEHFCGPSIHVLSPSYLSGGALVWDHHLLTASPQVSTTAASGWKLLAIAPFIAIESTDDTCMSQRASFYGCSEACTNE